MKASDGIEALRSSKRCAMSVLIAETGKDCGAGE